MKKIILLIFLFVAMDSLNSQGFVSSDPDSVKVPCITSGCYGTDWNSGNPASKLFPFSSYSFMLKSNPLYGQIDLESPCSACHSKEIIFYNYNFALIPHNSIITGVEVNVIRETSDAGQGGKLRDSLVKLNFYGQNSGINAALSDNWRKGFGLNVDTVTYGGRYDSWGVLITPDMINGTFPFYISPLGISFIVKGIPGSPTSPPQAPGIASAVYYQARIKIYYDLPTVVFGDKEINPVLVYPNPSVNEIKLDLPPNFVENEYEILDAQGREVGLVRLNAGSNSLNFSHLINAGTYYLNLGIMGRKSFILK